MAVRGIVGTLIELPERFMCNGQNGKVVLSSDPQRGFRWVSRDMRAVWSDSPHSDRRAANDEP